MNQVWKVMGGMGEVGKGLLDRLLFVRTSEHDPVGFAQGFELLPVKGGAAHCHLLGVGVALVSQVVRPVNGQVHLFLALDRHSGVGLKEGERLVSGHWVVS